MQKIKLDIFAISYSQTQTGAYALILGEKENKRRLPIIIGPYEAQSIAIAIENMKSSRPLTHDLLKNIVESYSINLEEVIIYKYQEGVFYAKLICNDGKTKKEIDSRTSDAVALAVRFKCPIYTFESIFSAAGIILDEKQIKNKSSVENKVDKTKESGEYTSLTISELEEKLGEAIANENYEHASNIRDEINRRKKD